MTGTLETLLETGRVEPVDLHLARHLADLDSDGPPELPVLAALACAGVRAGHVCLPLRPAPIDGLGATEPLVERLLASPLVGRPGTPGVPLILDGDRLYLARYHAWERQVIAAVEARLRVPNPELDLPRLRAGLSERFSATDVGPDWQRLAAALAVMRPFCVISGGPGTGKTWTVAHILGLLRAQPGGESLRVALAAPTGKAAARLNEALASVDPGLAEWTLPAQTLHRLLGMRPGRVRPRHGAHRPLPVDLLVVDETSMVDLPLMARLMVALPPKARLVLLGDPHQLASVEAGQVMADLCAGPDNCWNRATADALSAVTGQRVPAAESSLPAMADHRVVLRRSRRFDPEQGIGRLAWAVNRGEVDAALEVLGRGRDGVERRPAGELRRLILDRLVPAFTRLLEMADPAAALDALQRIRALCAVREGPQGVLAVNRWVEAALGVVGERFYHGRPVMVTVNDYALGLFNGDQGVIWRVEGRLQACFPDGKGGVRRLPPSRLPAHETVYAMTIHKSQGSEFDEVVLALPEEDNPLVTRELLYTGVTRARRRVVVCASEAVVARSVARTVHRVSGLRDALWG